MDKKLTVADFFCGAGGFSEGFRQAGFEITFALDNWNIARQTHKLNHPNCKHPGLDCHFETGGNILQIPVERINEIVDDVDVIIGSPPCVSFSSSNKAGNADKSLGLELIEKYLQIIAIKKYKKNSKLKYWLMENVPNSRNHVKKEYTFGMLGLNNNILKSLKINKKENQIAIKLDNSEDNVYDSVHFGVAQKRKRFVCGEFPKPKKTTPKEKDWITLGMVINSLKSNNKKINDPIYQFSINQKDLTDHYYNTTIHHFEWEEAKIKKQQARYYGKMSFPENEDKPSRTVMATRSVVSRESMVLPNDSPGGYRSPTIREVASIMSFPITYLFQANNEASKYRLVGNAVCPKLAYNFAKSILEKENKVVKNPEINVLGNTKLIVDLRKNNPSEKILRDKHPRSNFIEIVPDLKYKNFRVELDNNSPKNTKNRIMWSASLHHATGKNSMKFCKANIGEIESLLFPSKYKKEIKGYIKEIKKQFRGKIPDSEKFQKQHHQFNPSKKYFTPRKSLRLIKDILDKHFPEEKYESISLINNGQLKFDRGSIPNDSVPLRILCAYYSLILLVNNIK
ncbi:MAG: DNA cytosine methyltransferase [Lutibacter sp.]|nr:DNA cytosine methyltransferase [Lutibacter sp.]